MPSLGLPDLANLLGIFLNTTVALLVNWFYSGTSLKSLADVQSLIDNVILHEDFNPDDLRGVNINTEIKKLDAFESSQEGMGWKEDSIRIHVPCPGRKQDESEAKEFKVEGVLYCDLLNIIISACQDSNVVDSLHTVPFKEMWIPSDGETPIRLYGEAYTSDKMLEAYEEVQNVPPDPEHIENLVIELFVYSDATRLAQFGTTSIWPVYFFLGNISKYVQCQPSSKSAHHSAYVPTVSLTYTPLLHCTDKQCSSLIHLSIGTETSSADLPPRQHSLTANENLFMGSGNSCSLLNSVKPMQTGLSSSFQTRYGKDSSHACLHIWQTIQKSGYSTSHLHEQISEFSTPSLQGADSWSTEHGDLSMSLVFNQEDLSPRPWNHT